MDSGNSGSPQSSSGGGDEFDSRGGGGVDSSPLSALLRPTPSAAGAFSLHDSLYGLQELTSAPPPPLQQHHQQQAAPWSAQFTAGASSSSPRVAMADAGMGAAGAHHAADASATTAQGASGAAQAAPRGSRKRTRASRRAPTTVLTTDTSNFRAMVQEFTGIPSPPFAAGAGAPAACLRTRFDHLFPSPSTLRSAAGAAADPASSLPPYLLRPFAQKLPTTPSPFPPFTSSSSSNIGLANADATTAAATATATATAASANPTATACDAFQLTSSALLRMQDPNSYLTFQNLLGSTQPSSQPMFVGFAQAAPRLHQPSPSEFLAGAGVGSGSIGLAHGGLMVSQGLHLHPRNDVHHGGDELSGVVAGGAPGNGSCKLNYTSRAGASSSSSAASAAKAPDGAAGAPARPARGEGLDPWICTSE